MIAQVRYVTLQNRERFVPTTVTTNEAGHRKSTVLWHYEYQDLYQKFTDRLRIFLPELHDKFPEIPIEPSNIEMQLTAHANGEYFKRHLDNGSNDTANRVLTYVYYYTLDDERKFSGGQLVLEPGNGNKYHIEPNHNTIVWFPSGYWHEVLPTVMSSDRWEDSRFTLNGWVRR